MKRLTVFFVLATAPALNGAAQDVTSTAFAMAAPEGWHLMTRAAALDNLGQIRMSTFERRRLLDNTAESRPVATYMKHPPASKAGLIPKIDVVLRANPAKTFEAFSKMIAAGPAQLKSVFPDFTLTEPLREVRVGGRRAVLMSALYSIQTNTGGPVSVRARMYAVMDGDAFFQITLTDGPADDCSAVFATLLDTIRFD